MNGYNRKKELLMDMESSADDTSSLAFILENGMLDESSVSKIFDMRIKNAVDEIHNHRISSGGEGKRWFTRVDNPAGGKCIVIAGKSEDDLYTKLYKFYFGEKVILKKKTILDFYPEWLKEKMSTDIKTNTAKRYDQDFTRFYKDEPLSKSLLKTPVTQLKASTLKTWAYQMIQKHDMTRRQYGNCSLIISQLLDYLVEHRREKFDTDELMVKSCLYAILHHVNRFCTSSGDFVLHLEQSSAKIKRVIDYVQHHYAENITVEQAAALINYSANYFSRLFHTLTGTSFIRYVKDYRLEVAAHLLRSTEKTITEIAEETGFCHLPYFSRSFQQRFGLSPLQYRKS